MGLSGLAYASIEAAGITALLRGSRSGGVILCYHNVVNHRADATSGDTSLHMDLELFRAQMQWLSSHYDVVPLRDLVDRLAGGQSVRRRAVVTFDDGYAGTLEHASPVLRSFGIPATLFVIADAPGRTEGFWWDQPVVRHAGPDRHRDHWLRDLRGDGAAILRSLEPVERERVPASQLPADWDTIKRAVAPGYDVGVHSATHRALPELADGELVHEIVTSREAIADHMGVAPELFSYPYGLWNERVRAQVQRAGYRGAVALDNGLVESRSDLWALPRINIPAPIPGPTFRAWTAGLRLRRASR